MNVKEFYSQQQLSLSNEIQTLRMQGRWFVVAEIVTFLAALGFVVLYTLVEWGWLPLLMALLTFILYIIIRKVDMRHTERLQRLTDLHAAYTHELQYLAGDLTPFDCGEMYVDAQHPFSFDLDIFGRDSLFCRINRTVTTGGRDLLATLLRMENDITNQERKQRANAVRELASRDELHTWRMQFISNGVRQTIDSREVKNVIDNVSHLQLPAWFSSPWARALACLSIVGFLVAVVLSALGKVDVMLPIWWAILQFFAAFVLCNAHLRKISSAVGQLLKWISPYLTLIRLTEGQTFQSPYLEHLKTELRDAEPSFAQLKQLLDALDRRGNILGLFFFDALALNDVFLVRRFLRWQQSFSGRAGQWIDAMSDMDALVSTAIFAANHPQTCWADVTESPELVYEATDISHPFLGEKAVKNDFSIRHGHFYIVTGANMAGKSTFLRSLGVNYVLARAAMPVFARSFTASVFPLFSSMRTTDDLAHGISYFNAELLRLRQLFTFVRAQQRPTLIILDEILKGTNSLDKLNGSRLFLETVRQLPVTGVIATHDLELSKMSLEDPEHFHNYCFEIELGDSVTYSYKITPGVARNQNATYLLKSLINSVDL